MKATASQLFVRGSKERHPEPLENASNRFDYGFGFFERTIHFPAEIKEDEVKVNYMNGLLTIHLPKATVSAPVTIKIIFEN